MNDEQKTKELIVSHKSALHLLRQYRINAESARNAFNNANFISNTNNNSNCKIDVLVFDITEKWNNLKYQYHIAPKGFTKAATFPITNNVYCVNPELIIIQLSTILNFYNLYLLVQELCGTYSINPVAKEFARGINQATSVKKIIKYRDALMRNLKFIPGNKLLNQVLKIAKDNSASPMESRLMLKLAGPRKYGCYGVDHLEHNRPVTLSKAASIIAGQSKVIPDISNAEYKVAIEYDSAQFHENSEQGQKDKRRRDALVLDGWKVHSIVPTIMNNPNSFHAVAISILKELNQNSRIRNKDFIKNRNHLFSIL